MASYLNDDAILNGTTLELIASAEDDTISLSGPFVTDPAIAGRIDGGLGQDRMILTDVDLTTTDVISIEETAFSQIGSIYGGNRSRVLADDLATLGTLTIESTVARDDVSFTLIIDQDFGPMAVPVSLEAGEILAIFLENDSAHAVTLDFSSGHFASEPNGRFDPITAGVQVFASAGREVLTGGSGDDRFMNISAGDQVAGGDGNDHLYLDGDTTGTHVTGGAGTDTLYINSLADLTGVTFSGIEQIARGIGYSRGTADTGTLAQLRGVTVVDDFGLDLLVEAGDILAFDWALWDSVGFNVGDVDNVTFDFRETTSQSRTDGAGLSFNSETLVYGTTAQDSFRTSYGTSDNTVYGRGGDDSFAVYSHDTTLFGGGDHDMFSIRSGNNQRAFGGYGNDTFDVSRGGTGLELYGGKGRDTFEFSLVTGLTVLNAGKGTDKLYMAAGSDLSGTVITGLEATVITSPGTMVIPAHLTSALGTVSASRGPWDDTNLSMRLTLSEAGSSDPISLTVGLARDYDAEVTLDAAPGETVDFTLTARGSIAEGVVIVQGSRGLDHVAGSHRADWLYGNAGNDRLSGNFGADRIFGGQGRDTLLGGKSDDVLNGGNGRDRVEGQAGNDRLIDGQGRDVLVGGSGQDTFVLVTDATRDVIADFQDGTDVIDLRAAALGPFDTVTLTETSRGLLMTYAEDSLLIQSARPLRIADLGPEDFLF